MIFFSFLDISEVSGEASDFLLSIRDKLARSEAEVEEVFFSIFLIFSCTVGLLGDSNMNPVSGPWSGLRLLGVGEGFATRGFPRLGGDCLLTLPLELEQSFRQILNFHQPGFWASLDWQPPLK